MICNHCGQELQDDSVFCTNCGNKITAQPTQEVSCEPQQTTQPAPAKRNVFVKLAFIFSIVGLCLCWIPYLGVTISEAALALSIVGLVLKKKFTLGTEKAKTALTLSIVGLVLGFILTSILNEIIINAILSSL